MVKNNIYKEVFKEFNCCVLIPTYNNEQTIANLVSDVLEYSDDVIIVNDGSTDTTMSILSTISKIQTVSYDDNKGKGFALRTGFKYALEKGYDYVITLDSDGQHYASDLPSFLNQLKDNPKAIIIGSRLLAETTQPGASGFANKFSNFWFRVETGIKLPDTQSGYRLYPIKYLKKTKWFSDKYEFEIEVIVRSAWKDIDVFCIPIDVFYPSKEERITHFRPFKDFFRISVLNTVLVTLALIYFLPLMIFRKYRKRNLKDIIKEDIISLDTPTSLLAISIGFGVFMGIFPVWGYQLIIGFFIVHLLKLNKTLFFIAANISVPPMIPFILYLSVVTGSFVIGDGSWAFDIDINWETIKNNMFQYVVGAVTLSIIAGIISGIISYFSIIIIKAIKK